MPNPFRRRGAFGAALPFALLAAAACAASPASAKVKAPKIPKIAGYNVEFTGSGGYDVNGTDSNGDGTAVKAQFHWDVKYYKMIIVRQGGSTVSTPVNEKKSKAAGEWSVTSTSSDPGSSCATNGTLGLNSGGGIEGRVQPSGKYIFQVSIGLPGFSTSGGDNAGTACSTTDFWHDWVASFSHIGNGDDLGDVDPITGFSILDKSDFNHGKIVDNLSNETLRAPSLSPPESCGSDGGTSCTQHFNWHGHLILTKVKI
ncbi:MAG: hypothetical protein REI11_03555 [Patulibacter sp.]|nr:hypothetical protein [Patulibacter sp.]